MTTLDARLHAYRADLADEALHGKVEAAKFVSGELRQVNRSNTPILQSPAPDSPQTSQALRGEVGKVFEDRNGYAWIQMQSDGYVGYVESSALSKTIEVPTHWVCVRSTLIYSKPDLKSHPVLFISMNAQVRVVSEDGNFAALAGGSFIFLKHLLPIGTWHKNVVQVAEQFLHTPYYWGGKSVHGIDCSGLVQVALLATGVVAPRDSDMQARQLGTAVNDFENLQAGDLVFWPGHVGIMQDATQLIHANGHAMAVTSEPLRDVIQRSDKPISNIKRL